ncbi:MLEC_2 [Blepharisma stoltei]|uniref:TNFR-Cys domain-containing protein n=1 Tax=Blepharisma stoltei TaxID=1481888 RepID=A0AAU9IAS4_9CILI|nr:unnamed protein product [Blepharisma stoltei]
MKSLFVVEILFVGLIFVYSLDPSTVVLALNCGASTPYTSTFGFVYAADNYYTTGSSYACSCSIGRTQNQTPYKVERYSTTTPSWGYRIPISTDGTYVIILQFAEIYFTTTNSRVFTIKIGNYVVKSSLDLVAQAGPKNACDLFVQFTLTSGVVYINGSSVTGAYSSGKLVLDFYRITENPKISGIILVKGDCSVADNCNMCYDLKCIACNSSTVTCTACIANATPVSGVCKCNANAIYVTASNTCVICDDLCGSCISSTPFLCNSCPSPYYLVSSVCLRACPYGFTSPCVAVSTIVIDTNFATYFYGTYGLFKTGTSGSSYYFFNSPESAADPIPVKNRGLYFSGGTYLETISAVYFSLNFSLGIWVWIIPGSGNIMTHSSGYRIIITETGVLKITLENQLEAALLVTTNSLSPANSAWVYLSYVISFASPSTTIRPYLNNAAQTSATQSGYIYRDPVSNTIILGKSSASNFNGYIYQFQLWNSAVSNFNAQYSDQICGTGATASCLWSCEFLYWINSGTITACDGSCSNGCTRNGSCNVCHDPLCSVCRGFIDGLCDQCVTNASGTPCTCNAGYMLSPSGFSCIACSTGCSGCTGTDYYQCSSCFSGYFLLKTQCLASCPSGYTSNSSSNTCVLSNSNVLSLNFQNLIQLDAVNGITVGSSNTNTYPKWESGNKDPIPSIYRGYYFTQTRYLTTSSISLGPWFSLLFWIKATQNGTIFSKYDGATWWLKILLASSKPQLTTLTLSDGTTTLAITGSSSISNSWTYLGFTCGLNGSGQTVVALYTGSTSSATPATGPTLASISSLFYNDTGALYLGSTSEGFTGWIWNFNIYNDNTYALAGWFNSGCNGCSSCPFEKICPDTCAWNLYNNAGTCFNCATMSCSRGCRSTESCNLCLYKECLACTLFDGPCSSCITNAYFSSPGVCTCNPNAFWDTSSLTCTICDNLCDQCQTTSLFLCSTCGSAYVPVSNVCLKSCPYGFGTGCTPVSTPVIDTSFNGVFLGTYGIFTTGASATKYQFFYNPESVDPIPVKDRGLYFDGQSYYMQSNVNVYLSHSFSWGAWIFVIEDGDFMQKYSRVSFSSKGDVKISLESPTTSASAKTISGSATSFTGWTYLSLASSLDLAAIATTITVSVNNAVFSTPNTYTKLIYRDVINTQLFIGKSSQSYFQGYIFDFKLWNVAVDFTITTDDICGGVTCMRTCNLTQYYDGADCADCDNSCTIGCTRTGSCNQCDDKLCAICTGFAAGLCTQCVSNAGNTPCACNPGYTVDISGFSCIKLALTCATGTGSQYNQCLTCNSPFYLLNTICTNECPDGYDSSSGNTCTSSSNPSLSISLNEIIQLDTVTNVGTLSVGLDNTNLYPLWENSDPSPAIYRGYYFNTKNSLQGGAFLISPWFTVSIWIRPTGTNAQYVFLKKDGTLEILTFKITSSTAVSLKINLSDRTLLTLTQTSGSSLTSKWNLMAFTGQIISSGAYQIQSYINNAASSAVTGTDATVYFFDSGKLYIGSDSSSLNGLKGFIYTLKIYTDQNKNAADWSSSCSGCTNCPVGGVCPSTCPINQFQNGSSCGSCDSALSCSRGCRSWDTCRLCADKTCYSCTSFSGHCTGCIPNASPSGMICACNSNAIWVHATESCDICDNLCSNCATASTIYFECSLCAGSNVLVGTICLRSCPTGFSTLPCTAANVPFLNEHFDTSFEGSYDTLVTSTDSSTYQFFNSPDPADPIPAKSRGLYFAGAQYLVSDAPIYLSHDFSVGLWVYPISGDIFQKDPIISINSNGTVSFLMETELEVVSLETSTDASLSDWVYLSTTAAYSSASTTLKFYVNNAVSWTTSVANNIVRDQNGRYLYIGKSQNSFFDGFVYTFKLWNYAVSSFSTEYSADICGGSGTSCLWNADITYYVDSGTKPCLTSCSYGCVRGTSCNICDDPLCNKCSSFYAGDCYECVAHASGTPCTCDSTYYLSSSGSTCLDCFSGCSTCTSSDYNSCSQCISGYYLFGSMLCDTQCPDGFIKGANTCQLDHSLILNLSFNDYIVLDTLNGFDVGIDNTGKYPNFDANDPVPAINRGYFFNGNSLMKMTSQSIFSPCSTILAWTYPQGQGAILLKSSGSTEFLKLTIDSSGFLILVITLNDASTLTAIASTNTMGSWHYFAFTAFIEVSGATTVSIYIDSSLLTTMTSASNTYFRDASSSILNLGMISSSSTIGFQGFLWSLKVFNDETHKDDDWPASSCTTSPCVSCPAGSFCSSYCPIWQYPDTTTCSTCKTSCGTHGCRTDQTCRLCLQKECYSCTSFSGNCLTCITNADFVGTQCQCNQNALWVEATETCDLCNSVCESCTDFTFTGCVKCASPLLMLSNVCVSFCPLGYSSSSISCTLSNDFVFSFKPLQIKDQVTDSQSNIPLYAGVESSFYPYYKTSDPYAAEYRGYYFRGTSYMKSKDVAPYLTISPIFTFVAWIRPHSNSGCIFSKQDSTNSVVNLINFSLVTGGFPSLTIKMKSGVYASYSSSSLAVTLSTWNFLMASSIISDTPAQQILFYVDTSLDNSPDLTSSWFQDIQSSFFISIGATLSTLSSSSNFYTGFLWSFAVYNSQKSAADLILFSSCSGCSVCPIALANVCLPDCELSNYWDGTSCQACQTQCNWGCVRYDKNCNLCQDVICSVCDDYSSVCITCMTNAHLAGIVCVCDDNYFWDTANEVCSQCDVSCDKCTAAGNSNCVSCASGYFTSSGKCIDTCPSGLYLYSGQCLASCPVGYVVSGSKCVLGKTFIFDLSFNSLKGVLTDSQSQIQAMTGNSQDFYPTYDSEDPIAAPLRGFYFDGSTSVMHLPIFTNLTSTVLNFTSSFTISIWINPEKDDGILIIKQDASLSTVFSIMLKAGYAQLELLFNSNGKIAFTSLNILKVSEWNHIAFTTDYQSANTVVSCYVNGVFDSVSVAISDYFNDLKTGITVTIGAQKASSKYLNFFKGFIFEIQGYNIVKLISSLALPIASCKETCQACPINGVCIPNCLISQFWIGPAYNTCSSCNAICKSCKDSGSKCNLCYDKKCLVCDSYNSGSCTTCKNGTSNPADCQCTDSLVWNSTADSCQSCPSNQYASDHICYDCPDLCKSCTGELECDSCVENAILDSQLCVCKPGYGKKSTSCLYVSFSVNLTVNYDNTIALNFSDTLMNQLTESQITLKISKGIIISWNITMINNTYYLITCTFGASVSYGTQITLLFNDLTQVLSTSNGMLKDSALTGILNKSLLTSSQQQSSITSNQVSAGTQAAIGVSVAVSCFNPNSSGLWAILNTISYLYFIPISGLPISDNIYSFFNAMNNANLIPNLFDFFVDQSQGHTPYADAVKFGFSNDLILINAGNQLTVLCYIIGIFPIIYFLAKCSERYIGKKFDAILKQYKFSTFLRFWVQSYLDIGFAAVIGLLTAMQNWKSLQNSPIEITNTLMCFIFTVLLIISPISLAIFSYRNMNKVTEKNNKSFHDVWGSFFYEFKNDNGLLSTQYYTLFFLRRNVYLVSFVFFSGSPYTQLTIGVILCIAFTFYIIVYAPFDNPVMQWANALSEIGITVVFFLLSGYLFDMSGESLGYLDNSVMYTVISIMGIQTVAPLIISIITLVQVIKQKLEGKAGLRSRPLRSAKVNPKRVEINNINDFFGDSHFTSLNAGEQSPSTIFFDETNTISQKPIKYYYPPMT